MQDKGEEYNQPVFSMKTLMSIRGLLGLQRTLPRRWHGGITAVSIINNEQIGGAFPDDEDGDFWNGVGQLLLAT